MDSRFRGGLEANLFPSLRTKARFRHCGNAVINSTEAAPPTIDDSYITVVFRSSLSIPAAYTHLSHRPHSVVTQRRVFFLAHFGSFAESFPRYRVATADVQGCLHHLESTSVSTTTTSFTPPSRSPRRRSLTRRSHHPETRPDPARLHRTSMHHSPFPTDPSAFTLFSRSIHTFRPSSMTSPCHHTCSSPTYKHHRSVPPYRSLKTLLRSRACTP